MNNLASHHQPEFEHQISSSPEPLLTSLRHTASSRHLIWVLAKRELKIRYSTGNLRQLWALAKPMLVIGLYLFVFVEILHVTSSVSNYALVLILGLLVWQPFIENIQSVGKSVLYDAELVKRSNIPRLIFPLYRTLLAVPEIAVIFLLFFAVAAYSGHWPVWSPKLFLLPAVFLLNYLLVIGISFWSNIWYFLKPDWSQLLYTVLPFLLWVTPVFYLPEMVPGGFRFLLSVNPFSSVICIFRHLLMGTPLAFEQWFPGTVIALAIFASGLYYFVKRQDFFAEKL